MEDVSSGVVLSESADDRGRFAVGTVITYSAFSDCFHFHLSVPVQHSTSVPFPSWRKQVGQGRYADVRFAKDSVYFRLRKLVRTLCIKEFLTQLKPIAIRHCCVIYRE